LTAAIAVAVSTTGAGTRAVPDVIHVVSLLLLAVATPKARLIGHQKGVFVRLLEESRSCRLLVEVVAIVTPGCYQGTS
jgi:hypothetical protein